MGENGKPVKHLRDLLDIGRTPCHNRKVPPVLYGEGIITVYRSCCQCQQQYRVTLVPIPSDDPSLKRLEMEWKKISRDQLPEGKRKLIDALSRTRAGRKLRRTEPE